MLSAYRAAEGFKGDAQVSSWLFAILKNKITDC
ncbi:sigma-70 family RNA polymerase sigma factor, partial [Neisseria sp. P0021.S004]